MINKKGLTIAEAVISMVLLAIITMGIYGVIMASVRSGKKPDMREDMAYAIETASAKLQGLIQNNQICQNWSAFSQQPVDCGGGFLANECCRDDGWSNDPSAAIIGGDTDLCGRPFNKEGASFTFRPTGASVVASSPFDENVLYYVDFQDTQHTKLCLLPPTCDTGTGKSYFYYTVQNVNKDQKDAAGRPLQPRFNIKFYISCSGQTM
ncbi:MAG: hypothetical protein FWF35_02220 [Elusimicrobia bacterium]|nr:hypothetical protein [Elusimicrobiota bacterium]